MNIAILEDERLAATRLTQLLQETVPGAQIAVVLESVREAIVWFRENPAPDVIVSDIHLSDGLSFDVFSKVSIPAPVIFTTAYDAYMLKAFKLNSIDYLLKPIDKDELKAAFAKYSRLYRSEDVNSQVMDLMRRITTGKNQYKSRFLVRHGERLIPILADQVAFIRADDKIVFLHTRDGKKYIVDDHLDTLEPMLDPDVFFRINRTYIAPLSSIEKIYTHLNGRLKVTISHANDDEIFVSKARAGDFKKWLGK